jgi:hypothetical protein
MEVRRRFHPASSVSSDRVTQLIEGSVHSTADREVLGKGDQSKDTGVDGRIILEMDLRKIG